MMNKRWRVAVLGLASATAMLSAMLASASPASASTDGNRSATAGTPPQLDSAQCHEIDASVACFEPSGDKIWVLDHKADGKAAAGYWENYLRDSAGDWIIYRNGQCTNHLTAGNWATATTISTRTPATTPTAARAAESVCIHAPRPVR